MAETNEKPKETIEERIERQEKTVKNLEESYAKTPSEDLKLQLSRERDTLFHLTNSLFGVPKHRAESVAKSAREYTLGKAVQSPSNEE
jgi:hypothetical protein